MTSAGQRYTIGTDPLQQAGARTDHPVRSADVEADRLIQDVTDQLPTVVVRMASTNSLTGLECWHWTAHHRYRERQSHR